MPLFDENGVVADRWRRLADEEAIPAEGAIVVPLARWQADRDLLLARAAPVGVALANTDPVEALADDADRLALAVLHFPKFNDGRAYSQARLLRGRFGFTGELRATGGVLLDQLPFLLRCGFDAFESEQTGFAEALPRARSVFSVVYQPAEDDRATAGLLRLRRRTAPMAA